MDNIVKFSPIGRVNSANHLKMFETPVGVQTSLQTFLAALESTGCVQESITSLGLKNAEVILWLRTPLILVRVNQKLSAHRAQQDEVILAMLKGA